MANMENLIQGTAAFDNLNTKNLESMNYMRKFIRRHFRYATTRVSKLYHVLIDKGAGVRRYSANKNHSFSNKSGIVLES